MKKLITIASVGLLALSIFGCSKKTTKNTATTNNTTVKTNTKVDTTSKKTTKKATTSKQTTTENKKEFKKVNYTAFMEKVNTISPNYPYKKCIVNGTYERSNMTGDVDTVTDRIYMLNQQNKFVTANSEINLVDMYVTNQMLKTAPNNDNFEYYLNEENEFKLINYSEGFDPLEFIFDSYGFLRKLTRITNITEAMNLKFDYFDTDNFDGYNLITKAEADEIASTYTPETYKYMGAYLTGTLEEYSTHTTYSGERIAMHYIKDSNSYAPYDTTVSTNLISYFNGMLTKYTFYGDNNFFYKNEDNELALISYRVSEDEKLYAIRTIKFNDCGYAKYVEDEIIEDNGLTETFYLENYNVEYLVDTPKVNVTLKAGDGLFSNGENEIVVTGAPGSKYAELDGYEVPTLTGASYSLQPWYEEYSDEFFDGNRKIFEDVTLVYGFVDNYYKDTPTIIFSFKGKDDENSNGAPVVVNFEYYTDKIQGITYTSFGSIYHTTKNYLTLSSTDSQSYTVWGPIKSISFGNKNGLYSEGNIRVTSITTVRVIEINDYAFANLTGLESFNHGSYDRFEYNIGDYAFYNCINLTGAYFNFAPNKIGKYAFANSGLKGTLQHILFEANMIDYCAFEGLSFATLILIDAKLDYDSENNVYTFKENSLKYLNYDPNWNGLEEPTPFGLYIPYYYPAGATVDLNYSDLMNIDKLYFALSEEYSYDITMTLNAVGSAIITLKEFESETELLTISTSSATGSLTNYQPDEYLYYVIDIDVTSLEDDSQLIISIQHS